MQSSPVEREGCCHSLGIVTTPIRKNMKQSGLPSWCRQPSRGLRANSPRVRTRLRGGGEVGCLAKRIVPARSRGYPSQTHLHLCLTVRTETTCYCSHQLKSDSPASSPTKTMPLESCFGKSCGSSFLFILFCSLRGKWENVFSAGAGQP